MIVNEIYNGSGLGNQLWRYVVTRGIAIKNGYDFGFQGKEKFKASSIFNLDWGKEVVGGSGPEGGPPVELPEGIERYYCEKKKFHPVHGCDITRYDEYLANVPDNTKIEGNTESELYIDGLKDQVREWLKIREDKQVFHLKREDVCILAFRGGEYVGIKDLFLPREYWYNSMAMMTTRNSDMKFAIITDDPRTAKVFFPGLAVYHFDTAADWVLVRNAKNIIMSNSSFAWIPTWINDDVVSVIAPKYWGKHNISDGFWAQGDSLTKDWEYMGPNGILYSYEQCKKEKDQYENL